MMLDVLFKIKDEQDHTLSFRRSCRYLPLKLSLHLGAVVHDFDQLEIYSCDLKDLSFGIDYTQRVVLSNYGSSGDISQAL